MKRRPPQSALTRSTDGGSATIGVRVEFYPHPKPARPGGRSAVQLVFALMRRLIVRGFVEVDGRRHLCICAFVRTF